MGPLAPEVYRAPFPSDYRGPDTETALAELRQMFLTQVAAEQVAAIIVEPVQGEGGFLPAPTAFLEGLRAICDEHGICLIADEVQTGFARTGKLFAIEHSGVEPDLITVAKSIAAGLPLSGVLGKAEILDAAHDGAVGGTYVGNPVAQAAALAVLDVIEEENLIERAVQIGETMRARMLAWQERFAAIGDVRGARRDARDRARRGPRDEAACAPAGAGGDRRVDAARPAAAQGRRARQRDPRALPARAHRRRAGRGAGRLGRRAGARAGVGFSGGGKAGLVAVSQVIAGRYELKETVGTGGMSTVYCAFDTLLERNVALKILHEQYGGDEEYVERFRREARAVAQLSHPNIVTVIDRGEEDGKQFIVFELIEGENLKELVERGGPLPVRRVLELGLEVGRALAFAHAQGLIHRDVKPQNVLLNGDGRAKVTDFGIVRSLDAVGQTETGTVLGTSHYIAPEQARGERVDAQTDVYSFGVVLHELLTGDVPYTGDNFLSVAMKHVNDPVPSVLDTRPDAPIRLASLIERCLAKEPADRPASMDEVVAELEAVRAELDAREDGEGTMIMRKPAVVATRPPRRSAAGATAAAPRRRLARCCSPAAARGGGRRDPARDARRRHAAATTPVRRPGRACRGRLVRPGRRRRGSTRERVADATDGDPATYWTTESYRRASRSPASASCSKAGRRAGGADADDRHARLHRRDPRGRLARGPVRHGRRGEQDRHRDDDLGARRHGRAATSSSGSPTSTASRT